MLTLICPLLPPQDTGLYYDRYLREVIEVLETDPHFREKLQTANTEDIKVIVHQCLQVEDPSMMRTVGQTADRVLSSSERTSG